MKLLYFFALFCVLPNYSWAFCLYSPLLTEPYQTTKGPGSYGRSASDVRYHIGYRWAHLRTTACSHELPLCNE